MKKMSRVWSVILTVAMVCSAVTFMPAGVFAAEPAWPDESRGDILSPAGIDESQVGRQDAAPTGIDDPTVLPLADYEYEVITVGSATALMYALDDAETNYNGNEDNARIIKLTADIDYYTGRTISNKKIIFDLNGKNLLFSGGLTVGSNTAYSYIDYIDTSAQKSGKFEVSRTISAAGSGPYNSLDVRGGSYCKLNGASITDSGTGTKRAAHAVHCDNGEVIVTGIITATI